MVFLQHHLVSFWASKLGYEKGAMNWTISHTSSQKNKSFFCIKQKFIIVMLQFSDQAKWRDHSNDKITTAVIQMIK